MGQVVAHLGDSLQAELSSCLPIFLERLRNEITRLTAVKALIAIASSPLRIDLRYILKDSLPVLSSFLRYCTVKQQKYLVNLVIMIRC